MKVSIITVVYNGEKYVEACIQSVLMQTYQELEYIVIDGASTDNTLQLIKKYEDRLSVLLSEPDKGMYDAINKGIALATGDVIGVLNADDMLTSPVVIEQIAVAFLTTDADAIYGDLNYIHPENLKVIRRWRTDQYKLKALESGWMPAHPTLYIKRTLFKDLGNYSLNFGTAADYEMMLRSLYSYKIKAIYLPLLIVNMRNGGQSNATIKSRIDAFKNDYKAAKHHQLPYPFVAVVLKKLRKIKQFFK